MWYENIENIYAHSKNDYFQSENVYPQIEK